MARNSEVNQADSILQYKTLAELFEALKKYEATLPKAAAPAAPKPAA